MQQDSDNRPIELVRPLAAHGKEVAGCTVLTALLVLTATLVWPTQYVASIALAPANRSESLSNEIQQYWGVASLAGINLNTQSAPTDFDKFVYLTTSADLAGWELKRRNILGELYPHYWNSKAKTWTSDRSPFAFLWSPGPRPPNAYDVAKLYDQHISIRRIVSADVSQGENAMIVLSYRDTDRDRASTMLKYIVDDANEILRQQAAKRATVQAQSLMTKLASVSVEEYRATLERLYSQQEQILMLTDSHLPFAAEAVSGVDLPAMKVPRRPILFGAIGGIIGLSLSYFWAIVVFNTPRDRPSAGMPFDWRTPLSIARRSWAAIFRSGK